MFMFVTTLVFIFIIRLRFPSKVCIATIFYKCTSMKLRVTEQIVNPIIVLAANFKVLKNENKLYRKIKE